MEEGMTTQPKAHELRALLDYYGVSGVTLVTYDYPLTDRGAEVCALSFIDGRKVWIDTLEQAEAAVQDWLFGTEGDSSTDYDLVREAQQR